MIIKIKRHARLIPHKTKDENFRLAKLFVVQVDDKYIIVPKGFVSDGASTPNKAELPAWGATYGEAAIVHDFLSGKNPYKYIDRAMADKIFYEIMLYRNCHWWKARMMYTAVRLFGWKGYEGN